jgi:hypothetical protein
MGYFAATYPPTVALGKTLAKRDYCAHTLV